METCKHDLNGLCTVSTCPDPTVFCNATERVVFTEELIAENARQQSENKRLLTRISEQDQQIGRLEGTIGGLEEQLKSDTVRANACKSVERLQADLAATQSDYRSMVAQRNVEIKAKDHITRLLADAQAELESTRGLLDAKDAEIALLEADNQALIERTRVQDNRRESQQGYVQHLESLLEIAKQPNKLLLQECAAKDAEIARLLTRISDQDQQIGRLEGNVEGLSRQLAVEKDKLAENMVWREQMKKDHCVLLERNIATNGEIGRLQAEAAALRQFMENLLKLACFYHSMPLKDKAKEIAAILDDTTAGQSILDRLQAQDKRIAELEADLAAEKRDRADNIRDLTNRVLAAEAREKRLRERLEELVNLKRWNDIYGKTKEYLERQPKAWDAAQEALKEVGKNA